MTEYEWLTSGSASAMLAFLEDRMSDRKLRLLACACCRRVWHFLTEDGGRQAVEMAERFADGWATRDQVMAVLLTHADKPLTVDCSLSVGRSALIPSRSVIRAAPSMVASLVARSGGTREEEEAFQSTLLRDVFGNPFRPVSLNPAWLTANVVGLANSVYDARAFHDLPILADALQDSGCDDEGVLSHCRGEGPHARGCFVIDMLTGRV